MKASWEMTSLDKLQSSLADAKNSLDDVNTKLRKITGREENYRRITDSKMENPLPRRISSTESGSGWRSYKRSRDEPLRDESESKEKRMKQYKPIKVSRIPRLQDSEILKVSEKPQRPNTDDEVTIQRNRRMFGSIMSTLKQFQMTEVRNAASSKEQRRREIAHKLEREEQEERELAANEKRELVKNKQDTQQQIACIEEKIEVEKLNTAWDAHCDTLSHFIRTKASPRIFYLPKRHTKTTLKLLENTKKQLNAHKTARRKRFDDAIKSKFSSNVSKPSKHKSEPNSSKHIQKHR